MTIFKVGGECRVYFLEAADMGKTSALEWQTLAGDLTLKEQNPSRT
jgi:hypothetical protein